jgi:hypothetical protein
VEHYFVAMFAFPQSRRAAQLLIILVTMLFLFPVAVGSFQATHGPTSTLKECTVGLLLQALIAVAGYVLLKSGALYCFFRFRFLPAVLLLKPPDSSLISLRC